MPIKFGSSPIVDIALGSQKLAAIYKGSDLIWSKNVIRENFTLRGDAVGLYPNWTDLIAGTYKLGTLTGAAVMRIGEGLLWLDPQPSAWRYNVSQHADDGYLEVVPATGGTPRSWAVTMVYRRAPNSGGLPTYGTAIYMFASQLWLWAHLPSAPGAPVMTYCGGFFAGDKIRLKQKARVHSMFRNGQLVGQWEDTGAALPINSSNRSVVLYGSGGKDLLGPRRFSPAIWTIEAR